MNLVTITRDELIQVSRPRFPKKSYRGEFRNHKGEAVSNIYVVDHRVYLAEPREFGNGEIDRMVPGNFSPNDFERAGGCQYSGSIYVPFWQFKISTSV